MCHNPFAPTGSNSLEAGDRGTHPAEWLGAQCMRPSGAPTNLQGTTQAATLCFLRQGTAETQNCRTAAARCAQEFKKMTSRMIWVWVFLFRKKETAVPSASFEAKRHHSASKDSRRLYVYEGRRHQRNPCGWGKATHGVTVAAGPQNKSKLWVPKEGQI